MSCHSPIPNFEFAREEIEDAVRNSRLLSLEIEPSLRCNFHCPYCYIPKNSSLEDELTVEEIHDVVLQAQELGAKKIIILGGEPMIYPHIMEMIKFIRTHHLNVEMFTNGSNITADIAKQLFDYGVNVVLKMNTLDEHIQDMLAGKEGAFNSIQKAFHNLKQARRPSGETFLAVSTVICSKNIDELVDMWKWLRDQNIIPYFEMITPQGNVKQNDWLNVEPQKAYDLFCKIAEIDRTRYGYFWDPQPSLVGNRCLRHQFSCLVTSQGYVMPCVGVTIPVGNIREQKLGDIIKDSEVIHDLRNYHETIKGPCRECEKASECYGCRGAAYQLTGDYLASDPMCWKNVDKQDEITRLPIAVEELIPQKLPMRVIDTLVKVAERTADVTVTLSQDMLFIDEDGLLDEAAYLEMIAQAIAALDGFKHMGASKPASKGFLLGAKKLEILGKAHVGDTLKISFYKYASYGGFGIVKGTVLLNNHVLAKGEVKIWHEI